ncbi:hypothetical protein [Comamonas sp. NoAH]|uniref:hypothetical protein n=1 Tax=Comamonas halotolerans TaxID=3041496 RepID=UPI0024E061BD|nr:hypothetical protein [Comamonas sp. NoAH]
MNKCNIQLVLPIEAKEVFGKHAIPKFIDDSNPPVVGDLIRLNGLKFVVKERTWDLDIKPPTLFLEFALQSAQS